MNILYPLKAVAYTIKTFLRNVFAYPQHSILSEDSYDEYWKDKRGGRIGELSDWQKERAEYILRILKKDAEPVDVVDIGCGDGSILHYLKQHQPFIQKMTGYGNSTFALTQADAFGIETHRLDVSKNERYSEIMEADYHLLLEVLEHIPNSEELLISVFSKAKKGVFISFPNSGYVTYRLRLLFGKFPLQWRIRPNEHVRFWTHADLVWWLTSLGLKSYTIHSYKGIPVLSRLWPSLCAAAFIIYLEKPK